MSDIKRIIMIAVLTGLMVSASAESHAQEFTNDKEERCGAAILQEKTEQMVMFQGFVVNNTDESMAGRYTLEAIREGVLGRSNSRQAGKFSLDGGKESGLSRISINIDDKDEYKVILKIYKEDILMCADSIVRPAISSESL